MTSEYDVWKYLYGKAVDQGLTFDPRSGLRNNRRTCDLVRAVQRILEASGHDSSMEQVQDILEMRIPNLVSSWTGVDTEAHRAVDKYFKYHPTGRAPSPGEPQSKSGSSGNPGGTGSGEAGQGEGDAGEGQGQGEGEGDESISGFGGTGSGEGEGEGQGQGSETEGEGEGEGEEGKGQTGGTGGTGGTGEGESDTPEPQDPNYIKPKIWNTFMRILMWNMEHPGKQKNVMLVGPRGIGKTEMIIQAAKALHEVYPEMAELPFMITSPQMKHEVTGYGNAMGEAVKTEFTKGYVSAGITLIEEMDRSEPTALIAMNAAMANKIMDTPVIGMIQQHPLCNIVATANTAGIGATEEYVTANQLDASTRDRFIYLSMDFDVELAVQIARGDKHLVEFVKNWNEACEYCGLIQNTCSYRALTDIKDLRDMGFTVREALESVVLKACVPKDNLRSVLDKMKDMSMNPYLSAMELIQTSMPDIGY